MPVRPNGGLSRGETRPDGHHRPSLPALPEPPPAAALPFQPLAPTAASVRNPTVPVTGDRGRSKIHPPGSAQSSRPDSQKERRPGGRVRCPDHLDTAREPRDRGVPAESPAEPRREGARGAPRKGRWGPARDAALRRRGGSIPKRRSSETWGEKREGARRVGRVLGVSGPTRSPGLWEEESPGRRRGRAEGKPREERARWTWEDSRRGAQGARDARGRRDSPRSWRRPTTGGRARPVSSGGT